ncbi:unnamed protein product [Cylindrotheca closterium]|uniref:Uncharacterized protein n=1 Tax=Cylindrotheca closterium TaxID=2856 RepID=A0AAD2FVI5_9STRA|nr:unnamed protein product [Cylindrotheca closterium]
MPPNSKYLPPFSLEQQMVLALVPKITAIPSIVGSVYIVQHVLRSSKRRQRTYHRLLAAMSTMDFIYAIKTFVSTWPNPEGTGYLASGTTETCEAAAVLGHGGSLSSILYNGSLTLYYLLTIAFSWRLDKIKRIEPFLHGLPLVIGWSTAFATLPMNLMNPIGWTCWIGSFPVSCIVNPDIECTRGENSSIYRWVFFHAELWACFLFSAFAMLYIYFRLRKNEVAIRKYEYEAQADADAEPDRSVENDESAQPQSGRSLILQSGRSLMTSRRTTTGRNATSSRKQKRHNLSQRFASQAWFYILAFCLTWIFPMITFVIAEVTGYLYFPLLATTVVFNPMQGFFNCLIYIKPRYMRYREGLRVGANVPPSAPSQIQCFRSALDLDAIDDEEELEQIEGDDSEKETTQEQVEKFSDRTTEWKEQAQKKGSNQTTNNSR